MTVRIGFIGCGTHATQNLYPSLRFADCVLGAVADPVEERRKYIQRHFGAERAYSSYEELFEKETLDAVMVCGPSTLHEAAGIAATRRSLPVFVEKPPAETIDGAKRLLAASKESGSFVMVAFMKRFAQKYLMAKEISSRASFGKRRHILMRYSYSLDLGDAHRDLYLMGIHAVDLVRFFMGEVSALAVERDDRNNFAISLRFENGSTGSLVMNATAAGVTERMELTGEEEVIVVDEVANLIHYPKAISKWKPVERIVRVPNFPLQVAENDSLFLQGYAGEVVAFVEAVKNKQAPSGVAIEDAIKTLCVLEEIARIPSGRVEL